MENGTDYRVWLVREESRGWPDEPKKTVKAVFAVTENEQDARTLVRVLRENEYEATLEKSVWQGGEEISVDEIEVGAKVVVTVGPHLFRERRKVGMPNGVQYSLRESRGEWSPWYDFKEGCVISGLTGREDIKMRMHGDPELLAMVQSTWGSTEVPA